MRFLARSLAPLLVLLAAFSCAVAATPNTGTVARRIDAFLTFAREDRSGTSRDRDRRIARLFEQSFGDAYTKQALDAASDEDLHDLFRVAWMHASRSFDAQSLVALRLAYAALRARGIATPYEAFQRYNALTWHRAFGEAAKLATASALQVPTIAAVDGSVYGDAPRHAWVVGEDGIQLEKRPLDIDLGLRIVAIVHPDCGFSKRALRVIADDSAADALFARHASLLIPQRADVDPRAVSRWNQAHPRLAMQYVHLQREWPQFDEWDTPIFYLLRDGRLVRKIVGWPDDARLQDLLTAARDLGMRVAP